MELTGTASIIILIMINIVKDELRDFIVGLWKSYKVYNYRVFDLDGNPDTDDVCLALNGATGKWGLLLIHQYNFWTLPKDRGVTFSHVNLIADTKIKRTVSFNEWDTIKKAQVTGALTQQERGFLIDRGLIKEDKC
jgi:hypothetical protein